MNEKKLYDLICEGRKKCRDMHCKECEFKNRKDCKYELIAKYLVEKGIIALPCKVGDVVYQICFGKLSGQKIIKKSKVTAIKMTDKLTITLDYTDNLCDADIGRWLFVGESAKEEAEQALKGGAE